ncbi:MAG: F0F1 ATP synthase subunit delta [Treponema sp.]|jgi:hypothetical protein|nr:F0F1 ATP synthase subunit delta [Treponema sp.]
MFVPQRWAQGFVNAAGDTGAAARALEFVKAVGPLVLSTGAAGTADARRLGQMFQRAFAAVPAAAVAPAAAAAPAGVPAPEAGDADRSLALGLILLLVKKNLLRYTGRVIGAIEQELDARRGILRACLEFAQDPGAEFVEQLEMSLKIKTGAAGVRLSTRAVPELLAGCRLRIGNDSIDASLQTRLKRLGADLARAYFETPARESAAGRRFRAAYGGC